MTRLVIVAAATLLACDGNPYDRTQIPTITVTPVVAIPVVFITWSPDGAQRVRVYKGAQAGGPSEQVVWSISGTGKNSLVSGIEYGTTNPVGGVVDVRGVALVPGQPYTVQVSRVDPRAGGPGDLTAAGARYQNTRTFAVEAVVVAP